MKAYRIEFNSGSGLTNQVWDMHYGKPTETNLVAFIDDLVASTMPGGVNSHLDQLNIATAQVVRQATDEVVAVYQTALFEAVEAPAYKPDRVKFNGYIEWRRSNPNGTYADYRQAQGK